MSLDFKQPLPRDWLKHWPWAFIGVVVLAGVLVSTSGTSHADSPDGGTVTAPVVQPLPAPDGGVQAKPLPTFKLADQLADMQAALNKVMKDIGAPTQGVPPSFWATSAGQTTAIVVTVLSAVMGGAATILGAYQAAQ